MTGIPIAASREWTAALDYFRKTSADCTPYPFGEYFETTISGKPVLFYFTGTRKVNSAAATQYMICKFALTKIIVAGTCAGIDPQYQNLDIFLPHRAVQYDCTVKEIEPLIKQSFALDMDLSSVDFPHLIGTIGTADKAVVMWKDYLELKKNGITIADTESAAVAWVCRKNNVPCLIVKGISDYPQNHDYEVKQETNAEQLSTFLTNTPKVMRLIFENYLPKLI